MLELRLGAKDLRSDTGIFTFDSKSVGGVSQIVVAPAIGKEPSEALACCSRYLDPSSWVMPVCLERLVHVTRMGAMLESE